MSDISINICIEDTLKTQADELFSKLGLAFSDAVTLFVKQAITEQRIPFDINKGESFITIADTDVFAVSNGLIEQNRKAYEELAK